MARAVDLDRARRTVVVKVLLDRCRITWDAEGETDDSLDLVTLKLTPPADDTTTVWEGPCKIKPVTQTATVRGRADPPEGPVPPPGVAYQATLPADAAGVPVGAVLEVVESRYDPTLVDARFVVDSPVRATLLVTRKLWLREM